MKFFFGLTLLSLAIQSKPFMGQDIPIMPVSEVMPGMTGVGKSVFRGDSIEEFGVEIIGTLKNFLPKKDIILVRMLGERLNKTGVIGGMSGSPVYIDGKLIGAVAYGWTFSKDPIAGITPIEQMLQICSSGQAEGAGADARSASAGRGGGQAGVYDPFSPLFDPLTGDGYSGERPAAGSDSGARLKWLEVPLIFSGCHPEIISRYGKLFTRFGLVPMAGGGGSSQSPEHKTASLEPGSAVAVQLVRGDMSLAVTGTITYRQGDRILAFGHPFLQFGEVDFPMTAAEVLTVLPNLASSFKLSNTTNSVGKITTDNANGVLGLMGAEPKMIPFDIELNLPGQATERFHYELVDHKLLTSQLGAMSLLNTFLSMGNAYPDQTFHVQGKVSARGAGEIFIEDFFAGSQAANEITMQFQSILSYLFLNNFGPADISNMTIKLDVGKGNPKAQVSEVFYDRNIVYPGDSIKLDVYLDPFTRPKEKKHFTIPVPVNQREGDLYILVGAGDLITRIEFSISPNRFRYSSLPHLIRLINESRKNNYLYLKVFREDKGLIMQDQELSGLPPSVWSMLVSEKTVSAAFPLGDFVIAEYSQPTDYILNGFKVVHIVVKPRS